MHESGTLWPSHLPPGPTSLGGSSTSTLHLEPSLHPTRELLGGKPRPNHSTLSLWNKSYLQQSQDYKILLRSEICFLLKRSSSVILSWGVLLLRGQLAMSKDMFVTAGRGYRYLMGGGQVLLRILQGNFLEIKDRLAPKSWPNYYLLTPMRKGTSYVLKSLFSSTQSHACFIVIAQ